MTKNARTIDEKVADTILQTPRTVTVCGKTYEVAPPTCATLIEMSKRIPEARYVDLMGDRVNEAVAAAKDSRGLFEQVAVLILGAKAVREDRPRRFLFFKRRTRLDRLTDELMECSPSEINALRGEVLGMMEVLDFFEFSASLQEVSLIQRTRAAEETTASGR